MVASTSSEAGTAKTVGGRVKRRGAKRSGTYRGGARYSAVERLLPEDLLGSLRAIAEGEEAIDAPLAARLDRQFQIEVRYGVSRRRVRRYLERLRAAANEVEDREAEAARDVEDEGEGRTCARCRGASGGSGQTGDAYVRKLADRRQRQGSVATILDKTLGEAARDKPELWDRRAYLMLVGLIHARLSAKDVSTEEVVKLAKALAENRRAEASATKQEPRDGPGTLSEVRTGDLPARFADVVRQVYGVGEEATKRRGDEATQ